MHLSSLWQTYVTHISPTPSTPPAYAIHPTRDPWIMGITHDSRSVVAHDLYVALPGRTTHGAHYIPQAIKQGAVAIALSANEEIPQNLPSNIPYVLLDNPRKDMALLADLIYETAQYKLQLIGLTGTNGKTTTSSLLAEMIRKQYGDVGLLGTVVTAGGGVQKASTLTTMESPALHKHFNHLVQSDVQHCVMEVSSIGLCESRVAACRFNRAAFLNLSEDHLDYHGDMRTYANAKLSLFTKHLADDAQVFINVDDAFGVEIVQQFKKIQKVNQKLWTFSLESDSFTYSHTIPQDISSSTPQMLSTTTQEAVDIYWQKLIPQSVGIQGILHTPWRTLNLHSTLLGKFNAYNLALASSIACSLEITDTVIQEVAKNTQVTGRMQHVDQDFYASILVDYAHTPDALQRALQALRPHCRGLLYCLFGCGGDRDPSKRILMGQAASEADIVILSNDNPRFEDEWHIAKDALQGLEINGYIQSENMMKGRTWVELDRALAIEMSIQDLQEGDVLLIAGKGHETYQEIQGQKLPFNDVHYAHRTIQLLKKSQLLKKRSTL
jgi:UDP-N-acetylmuramoyl-L-alanyl-D-glutamate--2,6-diaminopimelate ligase